MVATLFWTWTWAMSGLASGSKVRVMVSRPLDSLDAEKYLK